ncbi:MAG: hypothetical protein ACEPOV_03855 [Hyphomicrobiales bacterium]
MKNIYTVINRFIYVIIFSTTVFITCSFQEPDVYTVTYKKLESNSKIKEIEFVQVKGFEESYKLMFEQPIDHQNPSEGSFLQKVYLSINTSRAAVVLQTDGYASGMAKKNELTHLLDANQVIVEHRFFGDSSPKETEWRYLDTYQSSCDYHNIYKALSPILGSDWLSTGISKGGQTTIYYNYYFPKDMRVCVPYVAPLNLAREDKRIDKFFSRVGNREARKKVKEFRVLALKRSKELLPYLKKEAEEKGYTFNRLEWKQALEFIILEYEFAFWQWGNSDIKDIPTDNDSNKIIYQHLSKVSGIDFFSDQGIERLQPFFYQALTELGMYGYDTIGLGAHIKDIKHPDFRFTAPKGITATFDSNCNHKVYQWMKDSGNNMIFVCGENDPWNATSFHPSKRSNSFRVVIPQGNHHSRLMNLPESKRDSIVRVMRNWLGEL